MADIPNCPRGREEEYLSDIAGLTDNAPNNPWSRKEAYLAAIDGKMDNIEEQIAALATDISFKGSVPTADDLPETAAVGDAYITEDTGIIYVYVGESGTEPWVALGGSGGGEGIKVLTEADYDYHRTGSVDDGVALWRLSTGLYKIQANTSWYSNASEYKWTRTVDISVLISVSSSTKAAIFYSDAASGTVIQTVVNPSTGAMSTLSSLNTGERVMLVGSMVTNNLTSTGAYSPLSANQGKVLNEKIVGTTETFTIATTDWAALASSDPYDYQTTVTATATINANTGVVELLNDSPVDFATYGFAIGAVNASTKAITIYSIGQPTASVSLKVNIRNL